MDATSQRTFGLIIAYVLPGIAVLWGISFHSPAVANWLSTTPATTPTVGGFLHVALGSLCIGLILSAIRWAILDTVHHKTGLPLPAFAFSRLQENLEAFDMAVEHYYRYYQFYGNMAFALPLSVASYMYSGGRLDLISLTGVSFLEIILFAASRDSLKRYYTRVEQLLGNEAKLVTPAT